MKQIHQKPPFKSQAGNIGIIAAIVIVAGLFLWQIWKPATLSKNVGISGGETVCRPEDGSVEKQISYVNKRGVRNQGSVSATYKRISSNRLIDPYFILDFAGGERDDTTHLFAVNINLDGSSVSTTTIDGKPVKLYEYCYGDDGVGSYKPEGVSNCRAEGNPTLISYRDSNGDIKQRKFTLNEIPGLLYVNTSNNNFSDPSPWTFDVYVKADNYKDIPQELFSCVVPPNTTVTPGSSQSLVPTIIFPTNSPNADQKQIQLKTASIEYPKFIANNDWLSPHCKPIIYLYPEQKQDVHVLLNPKGYLTETIPHYPKEGWFVTAYPDGRIDYKNKSYEYLYYESKILDTETKVPKEGFVRKASEMKTLFAEILPKLGLNQKEAKEFSDYWLKALPKAPYYFIGIMDRASIDHIEPLTISPKPDTIIRVRTYFKALEKPIDIIEPRLDIAVERNGFSLVEWGGMVKRDANHPFTCSE